MQNCKYNKSLIKKNDFFKWYICDRCGLINNKIIKDQKYFQSTKNKLFNNKNSTNKFELENFYSNNIEKLSLKRNIIWFDYGCGNGDSLLFFKKIGFKNIYGYEPNQQRRNNCINKGINVVPKLNNIKKKNDAIFVRNVFDYVENFPELIKFFSNRLKNNGHLIIIDKIYNNKKRKINIYSDFNSSLIFRNVLFKETFIYHLKINKFKLIKIRTNFNGRIEIIAKKQKKKISINNQINDIKKLIKTIKYEIKFKYIYIFKYEILNIAFKFYKILKKIK
jgi:SAM-dependent methyltransferase